MKNEEIVDKYEHKEDTSSVLHKREMKNKDSAKVVKSKMFSELS